MSTAQQDYNAARFLHRQQTIDDFIAALESRLDTTRELKVLDLGCGTGLVSLALCRNFPNLQIVGIDISEPNIRAAKEMAQALLREVGRAPQFHAIDYLRYEGVTGGFDYIVSDGVIHLIPGDTDRLTAKFAADLAPGGHLICTCPVEGFQNSALLLQRRLWRLMPKSADNAALLLARLVYPNESEDVLEDRLRYMRITPARMLNNDLVRSFSKASLEVEERSKWPSPSAFKLKNQLVVCRKTGR